jgi:hypothetical protein
MIVLSAIYLAMGDIDPASKTFTELGITRNLYPRILFYYAALLVIGGLLRATWKAIPKLNQQADKVQIRLLAELGSRHYTVASILGPAAFTFVWVETFRGHRIVAVAVALAFVVNAALANYAILRWNQALGAQRDTAKLLWRYPVFLTIGALAIITNVFSISASVGLTVSLFLIPNSVEVLMIIRKSQ